MMGEGNLEFKTYARLFLGWWWLFAISAIGAGFATYYVSSSTVPIYESRVKVVVERHELPGVTAPGDLAVSEDLAESYVDLIRLRPVLEDVARNLPVSYGPGQVSSRINVRNIRNILEITASDSDPVLAAVIANTTAETFIRILRDRQLSQLSQFQDVLGQYGIQQEDSIVAAQASMLGVLSIVEPAIPNGNPSNINTTRNVAIAVVLGILLAGLAVLSISYFDDRFKTPQELRSITGLPSLGIIPLGRFKDDSLVGASQVKSQEQGVLLESYKFLWTNLEFSSASDDLKTILVSSSGTSEGKSTTASNLAVLAAGRGKSVVLVDADLRSSSLHKIFGLDRDQQGLGDVLAGQASIDEVLTPTETEGLSVITHGSMNSDPLGSLSSSRMQAAIEELRGKADLVILDSPPILAVTDAMILASLVDSVLMVVDAQATSKESVALSMERLNQAGANVIGSVLNMVKDSDLGGRYMSHYRDYIHGEPGKIGPLRVPSFSILSGLVVGSIILVIVAFILAGGPQGVGIISP